MSIFLVDVAHGMTGHTHTHTHMCVAEANRVTQMLDYNFVYSEFSCLGLLVTYTTLKGSNNKGQQQRATTGGNINECKQQQSIVYYQKPRSKMR